MDDRLRNVTEALEMAVEELSNLVSSLREQGAEAFRAGDRKSFESISAQLETVEQFQRSFAQLQQEWARLGKRTQAREEHRRPSLRRRATRGELLPEHAYVFPILEALREAGGSARVRDVLREVGARLRDQLTQRDREYLTTGQIRWENRAQWVRKYLVWAGFLKPKSPVGVWEITSGGLRELEANDLESTWAKMMRARQAAIR